jgi:hypothetical protein
MVQNRSLHKILRNKLLGHGLEVAKSFLQKFSNTLAGEQLTFRQGFLVTIFTMVEKIRPTTSFLDDEGVLLRSLCLVISLKLMGGKNNIRAISEHV